MDFSIAWTAIHLMLSTGARSPGIIPGSRISELCSYIEVIKDYSIDSQVR